jgi:DNA-binding CsgD family transcriptional regulator
MKNQDAILGSLCSEKPLAYLSRQKRRRLTFSGDARDTVKDCQLNKIDNNPIPGFSLSELLTDIFTELLEPIIIVGRDRKIVFKSRSFEDVVGRRIEGNEMSCDLLILPSVTGCCIDAIDNYPDGIQSGIWNVRRPGGTILPVLASWQPVNVGSQLSLLAIQCAPIELPVSSPSISFFRGIRRSSRDEAAYMARTANYLRQTLNCSALAWLDMSEGTGKPILVKGMDASTVNTLQETAALSRCRTQDILVPSPGGAQVFHQFSGCFGGRKVCLSVGGLDKSIGGNLIDALQSVVSATFHVGAGEEHATEIDADYQSALEAMTPAEADIMDKLLIGMTDKEIAAERGVSPHTVKNQVKRILKKACAQRRVDLVRRFQLARGGKG